MFIYYTHLEKREQDIFGVSSTYNYILSLNLRTDERKYIQIPTNYPYNIHAFWGVVCIENKIMLYPNCCEFFMIYDGVWKSFSIASILPKTWIRQTNLFSRYYVRHDGKVYFFFENDCADFAVIVYEEHSGKFDVVYPKEAVSKEVKYVLTNTDADISTTWICDGAVDGVDIFLLVKNTNLVIRYNILDQSFSLIRIGYSSELKCLALCSSKSGFFVIHQNGIFCEDTMGNAREFNLPITFQWGDGLWRPHIFGNDNYVFAVGMIKKHITKILTYEFSSDSWKEILTSNHIGDLVGVDYIDGCLYISSIDGGKSSINVVDIDRIEIKYYSCCLPSQEWLFEIAEQSVRCEGGILVEGRDSELFFYLVSKYSNNASNVRKEFSIGSQIYEFIS